MWFFFILGAIAFMIMELPIIVTLGVVLLAVSVIVSFIRWLKR